MHLNKRVLLLVLFTAILVTPYIGFATYCLCHYPSGAWPLWTTYLILVWFIANMVIGALAAKKMYRGVTIDLTQTKPVSTKLGNMSIRLVIFWSLLFLYGLKETVQGKYPLDSAVPAGMFLLLFIGIFGWYAYRIRKLNKETR
jgi:hypothetical protein